MGFLKTLPIKRLLTVVAIVFLMSASLAGCELGNIFSNNNTTIKQVQVNAVSYLEEAQDTSGVSGYVSIDNLNNQTGASQISKKSDQTATVIAVANEGYIFEGWYTHSPERLISVNNIYVVQLADYVSPNTNAMYFYAHFGAEEVIATNYQVEFINIANSTIIEVEEGQNIGTQMPNNPSRAGYTFIEWNTVANGSGQAVTANTVITQNLDVYALWQINTYTVNFNANGGVLNSQTSFDLNYNDLLGSNMPTAPVRTNYTFVGWNTSNTSAGVFYNQNSVVTNNITLYAVWQPNNYLVIFNANGASSGSMSPQSFYYGVSQSLTQNTFIRIGYTFVGWSTSQAGAPTYSNSQVYTFTGSSNITLYAVWTPATPTITLSLGNVASGVNSNGWVWSSTTYAYTKTFNYGVVASTLPVNPTRTGYSFAGWNQNQNGSGSVFNSSSTVVNDATYYAVWIGNLYTVTLNHNGGTNSTNNVTVNYDQPMPMAYAPIKTGYTFGGYYDADNGAGTQHYTSNMMSAKVWDKTSNATLYAKWTANTYTVTFNANGGNIVGETAFEVAYNSLIGSNMPTNPTFTGYTFMSWNTSSNGSGVIYTENSIITTNVTLYAIWAPITPTITLNLGNVPGASSNAGWTWNSLFNTFTKTLAYGYNVSYTPSIPSKLGHTFAGWYENEDGTGNILNSTTKAFSDATYYPIWTPTAYALYFFGNGADSGNMPTQNFYYNVPQALNLNTYLKTGYTFIGWSTSSIGSVMYLDGVSYTIGPNTASLHAIWQLQPRTIIYNPNGGNIVGNTTFEVENGTIIGSNMPTNPTRTGYTFMSWNTLANGAGATYTENSVVTANLTLYATWQINTYTVTFNANGGVLNSPSTRQITAGTLLGAIWPTPDPTKTGYTFMGWSTTPTFGGSVVSQSTMISNSITLYALWQLI